MTLPAPSACAGLDPFRKALAARAAGTLGPREFCEQVRALPVPETLPPAFGRVLADLLDRIESSALFGGESCSFSETDLDAALRQWLEKAEARLLNS